MIMMASISKETVTVISSSMKDFVHDYVNKKASSGSHEHYKRFLYKLLISYPLGGLVNNVE
jgi:hypothetical protein